MGDLQAYQGTEGHPQGLPLVLGLPACCLTLKPCPGVSFHWRAAKMMSPSRQSDTHFVLSIGNHTTEEAELFCRDFYWNAYWCQKTKPTQTNWLSHTRSCVNCSNWLPCLNRPCRSSPTIPIPVLLTFPMTSVDMDRGCPAQPPRRAPQPRAGVSRGWRWRHKRRTGHSKRF